VLHARTTVVIDKLLNLRFSAFVTRGFVDDKLNALSGVRDNGEVERGRCGAQDGVINRPEAAKLRATTRRRPQRYNKFMRFYQRFVGKSTRTLRTWPYQSTTGAMDLSGWFPTAWSTNDSPTGGVNVLNGSIAVISR
jgi:hypothetical protein